MAWLITIVLAVIALIILVSYLKLPKCPKCNKRNSYEVGRTVSKVERIQIQKEEKINHYSKKQIAYGRVLLGEEHKPSSVTVRKYTVPGKRTYYNVRYRCKDCGTEYTRSEYTEEECV